DRPAPYPKIVQRMSLGGSVTTAEIQDEKTGKIAAFKVGTGRLLGAAIFALLLMLGIAGRAEEKKPVVAGLGRANGQVLDADGKALAGAKVTLRIGEGIGSGPPAATTDAAGKWALLGLAPGRWRLTVQAVGWIDAEGWVDVPEEGPGKWVRLKLR